MSNDENAIGFKLMYMFERIVSPMQPEKCNQSSLAIQSGSVVSEIFNQLYK